MSCKYKLIASRNGLLVNYSLSQTKVPVNREKLNFTGTKIPINHVKLDFTGILKSKVPVNHKKLNFTGTKIPVNREKLDFTGTKLYQKLEVQRKLDA